MLGQTLGTIIQNYKTTIKPYAPADTGVPAVIFAEFLHNDFHGNGTSLPDCIALLRQFVDLARGDGFYLVLQTIPDATYFDATMEATRAGINSYILANTWMAQARYDLDSWYNPAVAPAGNTTDGIHPDAPAANRWGTEIVSVTRAATGW